MSSPPSDRPFKEYQKTSSSAAGCFIFITIAAVVTFLLAWAAYTFYTQNKAIDAFTVDTPLQIVHTVPSPEETTALTERLRAYAAEPPTSR